MQFSTDWIRQYIGLPEGADNAELGRRLTAAGLAVEGEEEAGAPNGRRDLVFDIDVTTNRPDCMNHLGLAREASVLFGVELKPPSSDLAVSSELAADAASLEVDDAALCPRYDALIIEGVRVGPSPDWLRLRLEAIGSRSINNVVDVTNFVLWETGQPLHAFDLDELAGSKIHVRRAREGEELVTLDGETRALDPEILVIADAERAIALAGIMGGLESEVTGKTTRVLLESAHFDPRTVRRGASKLGMHTDASHRFERGADPEACLWAARRAAALIAEVAGGTVRSGELEFKELRADWPPRVDVELSKIRGFGGAEISAEEVETTLRGLGFALENSVLEGGESRWTVTAPSWRYYDFDDAFPADVYEEVWRVYGFDNIESTIPKLVGHDAPARPEHMLRRRIADHLVSCGLAEAINFGFHSRAEDDAYANLLEDADAVELANPLSDRYAVMRRSMLPNMVTSALFNQRRGATAVQLFEIGHVFSAGEQGGKPREIEALALAIGGSLGSPWSGQSELDFYDLKGILESLADVLGTGLRMRPAAVRGLLDGAAAEIFLASAPDRRIGYLGRLDSEDPVYPLYVAELETECFLGGEVFIEVQAPSRYPAISVDSTLTHDLNVSWEALAEAVRGAGVEDLTSFGLKDRYQGKGVPDGAVNTTISFVYNSDHRSLTQEEVNDRHVRLTTALNERFGVEA